MKNAETANEMSTSRSQLERGGLPRVDCSRAVLLSAWSKEAVGLVAFGLSEEKVMLVV